jgi:hypothetical protein
MQPFLEDSLIYLKPLEADDYAGCLNNPLESVCYVGIIRYGLINPHYIK